MAFKSMKETSRKARRTTTQDKLLITHQKNRDNSMVVFYIGSNLLEAAGMQKGDKLDVLWNDDGGNEGLIQKDSEGKTVTMLDNGRGILNFTWRKGMPIPPESEGPVECLNVKANGEDEEIYFGFPDNCL
jgi:hypothetical protein